MKKQSVTHWISITLLATLLVGCAMNQSKQDTIQISPTAADFLQKASTAEGDQQQQYQLEALEQLLTDKNLNDADQLLAHIDKQPSSVTNHQYKLILQAQFALQHNNPRQAVSFLRTIYNPNALSPELQLIYYKTSIDAYLRNRQLDQSILARIHLDTLLTEDEAKKQNGKTIWKNLLLLSDNQLTALLQKPFQEPTRGWLQLAAIEKQYANQPGNLITKIKIWQQQHVDHAANILLPDLSTLDTLQTPATHIALLLPLHGQFADMGKAVRDGFMTNFYNNAKYLPTPPSINVYDTSQQDIITVYQQAIDNGAELIIGPLTKNNVSQLAQQGATKAPIIALNYLDGSQSSPTNFIQFGLSPTQSAEQIAFLTWLRGANDILIMTPDDEKGTALSDAFSTRLQELGGNITLATHYSSNDSLSNQIKTALNINQSEQRAAALEQLLGTNQIKSISRRRNDLNGIFLVASSDQARQLFPLLKFYYVGTLPVFSVANIFDGYPSPHKDHDLNGIYFNGMPLILTQDSAPLRTKLHSLWPANYRINNRLYGLGIDAYTLSTLLPRLTALPNFPIQGVTGELSLMPNQQIYRQLTNAQFQKGLPQPIII